MLFNSIGYAVFLPIIFFLYWFAAGNKMRAQNILLMIASYFFYGCWDWRFLFLLAFSTFLDFYTGIKIHDSNSIRVRKVWLIISVATNLGFLGFFKYYNFFIESFERLLNIAGSPGDFSTLDIILPVGISFYTFHGLSYVFDIYYKRIEPRRNPVDYALFVSFFPLLVAGPIERATHLLPQVEKPRTFNYDKMVDGLRQILWGLFKKVVVADTCAESVNAIFAHSLELEGSTLALAAILFAVQIYGDFSGYSDIALGSARLFGFELLRNFAFPYFSRDIAEFWRRWHISLSSWFRDYLYIPLGGSKAGIVRVIINTFIIFTVSGFWHGANWNFIAWGMLNAIYITPLVLFKLNRHNLEIVAQGRLLPTFKELLSMLFTMMLVTIGWIFFRSGSVQQAVHFVIDIFKPSLFTIPDSKYYSHLLLFLVPLLFVVEWFGREGKYALESFALRKTRLLRWSFYFFLVVMVIIFSGEEQEFIYFQF